MAKIWPVYEGSEPTGGEPWADLPASEVIRLFGLQKEKSSETPPRFGDVRRDLQFAGLKHIVVEMEEGEVRPGGWKPAFYRSDVTPPDAFDKLVGWALAAELGKDNIIRVNHEPTIDSRGHDAVRIRIVIAPKATRKLEKGAALNALVRLREQLHNMLGDRTPIVEYATEAELAAEDATP